MQEISKKQEIRIGEIFLQYGLITQEQLARALERQNQEGGRLGSVLRDMQFVDDDTLLNVLSKQLKHPAIDLFDLRVPADTLSVVPYEQVRFFKVLPFRKSRRELSLAMVDPGNAEAIHSVEFHAGASVKPHVVPQYQMDRALCSFEEDGYGTVHFEGRTLRQRGGTEESTAQSLYKALKYVIGEGATDFHLSVGVAPGVRVKGDLKRLSMPVMTASQMRDLASELLEPRQMEAFQREGEVDFVLSLPEIGRLRMNLYQQRSTVSLSARLVFEEIPSCKKLGLPSFLSDHALGQQGLILIAGIPGSGKTTTMASLFDLINRERSCNIVTLEDPIEYLHRHGKSNMNQREVGIDTESYSTGLRHILRKDANVIGIGELRDCESISAALSAAETGSLVIAGMNSLNAVSAIERIVNIFPDYQRPQIKMQLADTLLLVFVQKLIPAGRGARKVLAYESLLNSVRVRNLIKNDEIGKLHSYMKRGTGNNRLMDQSIAELCIGNSITVEEGYRYADSPGYCEELIGKGQRKRSSRRNKGKSSGP